MRKIFVLAIIISLMALFCSVVPLAQAKVSPAGINTAGVVTAGNNIYTIAVRNATNDGSNMGTYTVATGPGHPATISAGTPQDVLFGGAAHDPWSTYLTIRSYNTESEYTSSTAPSPSPTYTHINLDNYYTSTSNTATSVTTTWNVRTRNNFTVIQTVAVEGTTISDSRVRVTTSVTNNGETDLNIGIRYEWDIMVDGEDGSYCKTVNPYGSWLSTEQDWTPPSFVQYQNTNDPTAPVFFINGSVSGPVFTPPPTPPEKLQFASWSDVYDVAFDYTTTGKTIAGDDSAMVYYWGYNRNLPITLAPGGSNNVTQYLFAPMKEDNPPSPQPAVEQPQAELPYTGK